MDLQKQNSSGKKWGAIGLENKGIAKMKLNPKIEELGHIKNPQELFFKIQDIFSENMLAFTWEDDKEAMDTFGNLIDKLITVNLKMWHNQEELYGIRKMTLEQFEIHYGNNLEKLHEIIGRCCTLNVQRANLMDEIDVFLADAIEKKKGRKELVREQCKIY